MNAPLHIAMRALPSFALVSASFESGSSKTSPMTATSASLANHPTVSKP